MSTRTLRPTGVRFVPTDETECPSCGTEEIAVTKQATRWRGQTYWSESKCADCHLDDYHEAELYDPDDEFVQLVGRYWEAAQ